MRPRKIDRFFFLITIFLCLAGFLVFTSASLGLLGREGADFTYVTLKQFGILVAGLIVMYIVSKINYRIWRRLAPIIFLLTLILTALVFSPSLGIELGGAKRWLGLKVFSFQPSELLKLGAVMFLAAWFSVRRRAQSALTGFWVFLLVIGLCAGLILAQPDTGTFMILFFGCFFVFWSAGSRLSHVLLMALVGLVALAGMAYFRPHVRERITTFLDPTADVLGTSYQVNRSLITIGSGGLTGRGFGQSVQKFSSLPQPIGDSIFAVAGEEFGLVGSAFIVCLFILFGLWGLKIASRTTDPFGRLLAGGIVILIVSQAVINMASMLGLMPLTGVPLPFVSQGGTALFLVLVETGIVMNISRYKT